MNKENIKWTHVIMFLIYAFVFFLLDYLNLPYPKMKLEYGLWLVVVNILMNLVMSLLSTYLYMLSSININKVRKMLVASNMSEIAVVFGILTYGCTPCVISFFAMFSIPFAVFALPLAGLPYKLISLALILIGIVFVKKETRKHTCKIGE